ncbi:MULTISPECIES: SfnB family sulfur acquisition oxidoreductase [unclassified Pseudomonas]|uniref:SfnB family sulfur acquisition oxidoreductase n=1 Tax=unclassified Pseudomonas TaxID=196821 RepID=UPI000DA896ED|nr:MULTISPECIES: SfnB family sulfur acquisition oxidoreductase [unclassified Pseudomonas]MDW3712088.1 SfnB family sulfur acquisition oxidoreductase [Pseudomonas sp. 2023EL-01195]PZE09814.1 SfnB family sulfur acquisition oxidoreductase [Pseudomonas sp. 57B-090624]
MTNETEPKVLRDEAPPLHPAALIENDAQALLAAHEVAKLAKEGAAHRDRERLLPWRELELFTRLGLGGIRIPRAYGGAEVSFVTLAEVFRILCAADPALGQIPQNQFGLLSVIEYVGSEAQKRKVFAGILEGRRLANAGPERNTKHTLEIKARITRGDAGLEVSGEKFYSTGALFAHWVAVKAIDDSGAGVLSLVERGVPGLAIVDDWSGFGQRTTASGTVLLDRAPVADDLVFHNGRLAEVPSIQGALSQLIQAAIDAGIAEAAIDDAIAFIRERSRPWVDAGVERASEELYTIAEIGRLKVELNAANALLERAGQVLDEVAAAPIDAEAAARASIAVAEAKVLTTEVALLASEKLFELAGSRATLAEFNLDRHWRNARVHTLHDPVRWKVHAVGNYHLNGAFPARHSWI